MTQASAPLLAARASQFDDTEQQRGASALGMWVFIATEVLFFGVLFAGYTIGRLRFPEAFAAGGRRTDLLLGSIETGILLSSSCLAALAVRDVQLGGRRSSPWLLLGTAALGAAFLVMHGFEYHSEYEEALIPGLRYHPSGDPPHAMAIFFCLYYFITGFHSLHVAIGVALLSRLAVKAWQGAFSPDYIAPVEVTALYWHLVDIVWIFVYPAVYLVGRSS
ncbi:cytochrome c oxidase subunit 3 [Dyella jiangningensis]|uniref:cytochrome c oxidase subunit 3 family protein n=1 Tax=Dyella sp. AtDHG13 TaxID=1938897 RepID=UPI00088F4B9E|nr:cytochrome c oxidase subunit 3 family protein [Dyella sp. AtDHG13]PXV55843.1 cytochrome c oxidase subunit 3 [Dyella sp. AtDHG13]SDK54328.1 cytochrome c oxidase subunit 3 [Dyella jiangningensis]